MKGYAVLLAATSRKETKSQANRNDMLLSFMVVQLTQIASPRTRNLTDTLQASKR